jgi:hypothetical protein
MARSSGRTSACDQTHARVRLAQAAKFLEVADLVTGVADEAEEYRSVAASLCVLSAIASADAACCVALGKRSRSADHHDAERLLEQVASHGPKAALDLRRLLNLKDQAQYGVIHVSNRELQGALRRAHELLAMAERLVRY